MKRNTAESGSTANVSVANCGTDQSGRRNVSPPNNPFAPASNNANAARQPSHASTFPCRDLGAVSDERMPTPQSPKKMNMSLCVPIMISPESLQLQLEGKRGMRTSCGRLLRATRAKLPTAAAGCPALPRPPAKGSPVHLSRQSFLQTRRLTQHMPPQQQ